MENQFNISQPAIELDRLLYAQYQSRINQGKFKKVTYGTAGFRSQAVNLNYICLRVGIFQGLISKLEKEKVLGIVLTASHNYKEDNGLKQSDFDGGMLRKEFEDYVDIFVQEPDLQLACNQLVSKISTNYQTYDVRNQGMIFIGKDTRPSSQELSYLVMYYQFYNAIRFGIQAVNCQMKDFGEVTTPMIHFLVNFFNEQDHQFSRETPTSELLAQYHLHFCQHYRKFYSLLDYKKKDQEIILLDCGNGVGGICMTPFLQMMKDQYNIITINTGQNKGDIEYLNVGCGAEFVHKQQKLPKNAEMILKGVQNVRGVSFDGDADRIIYYVPSSDGSITLLDGDKQISLVATFFQSIIYKIQDLVKQLNVQGEFCVYEDFTKWTIGMVQTAYANGASTNYLKSKGLTCELAATGVKNLHPAAINYDIGIYCESNGHGTFHVNHDKLQVLEGILSLQGGQSDPMVLNFLKLIEILYSFIQSQNTIMGDAMTNFLCFEQALAYLNINEKDWANFYKDLKCKNSTVKVADRTKIKVTKSEERIIHPASLQEQVDLVVQKNPGTRAFIRPSGTEDIVRVYVEADDMGVISQMTKELQDALMNNKEIN